MENENQRRKFLKNVTALGIASASGMILLSGCGSDEEKEVSPPEDLMQEHGLLNRILLIYDHCRSSFSNGHSFDADVLLDSAGIIRSFVEDYHEKQEEDYLFPRFEKSGQLTGLVATLRQQHQAGRNITTQIMELAKARTRTENQDQQLMQLLTSFNTMYRPHEAREDTVLFPAFRKIVSQHEYDSLGEEFEKNEQQKFGEDGFESMVDQVATLEKKLGIYELSLFTPKAD